MRASVFTGPGVFAVEERPTPTLEPGTALIKVEAVGICGSDLHGYTGETGRRMAGMIMGHEIGGRIHDVAGTLHGVTSDTTVTINPLLACGQCLQCRMGRENVCPQRQIIGVSPDMPGGYAEFVRVPLSNVVPLGTEVPFHEAALVEPLAVGYYAVTLGLGNGAGQMLVIGGGPIGIACALAGTRLGVEDVLVAEPLAGRRAFVESLGYRTMDPASTDLVEYVMDLTSGVGVPLVVDAVGSDATIGQGLRLSAPGHPVVVVGLNQPSVTCSLYDLATWERSLIGSFCYPRQRFIETANWVASRPRQLNSFVGQTVGLDTVNDAFAALTDGSTDVLKVIIAPQEPGVRDGR